MTFIGKFITATSVLRFTTELLRRCFQICM